MEFLFIAAVLSIGFNVGFLVGRRYINHQLKSLNDKMEEVPPQFLMNGDIDRALHIAGIKEASIEKQMEWKAKNREKVETETKLSMEDLLKKFDKDNLQYKAGIKPHHTNPVISKMLEATDRANKKQMADITKPDGYDPIEELKTKSEAARKLADKEKIEAIRRNFEELPLSRLSVEGMNKVIEVVHNDLQNKMKDIEQNTPEIKDEDDDFVFTPKPNKTMEYVMKPKEKHTKRKTKQNESRI